RLPRQAIRLRRHSVGSPHVKGPKALTEMTLQGFLGGDGRNGGAQVRIGFLLLRIDCLNIGLGNLTDKLTVVAIAESGSSGRIPQVEGFRFGEVAKAVEIRNEPAHITRHIFSGHRQVEYRRQQAGRLVRWKPVEALVVIGTPAAGVLPSGRLIDVVAGKSGRGPVMPVRARFGVYKE